MFHITEECEFICTASNDRCLIMSTAMVNPKTTKNTAGVAVMTLKKNTLESVVAYRDGLFGDPMHYRTKNLPAAGCFLRKGDDPFAVPIAEEPAEKE